MDNKLLIAELRTADGVTVGVFMLKEKQFKTGSRGFYGNGKAEIAGKRYQTQVQLVEIGSKPADSADGEKAAVEGQKKARRGR